MQVKKKQLELDMKQQTGFNYVNYAYYHPDYLTYMQSSTLWKMPG